ncbi:MAG: glycosyltransferase [Bacteroidales bacterium]|nr:glycosyltransferase [Bacteroidales bacterium]
MKILTIIPLYNAVKWIDKCINSALNSSLQSEIFTIDNGSHDETGKYLKENYSHYKNIHIHYVKDNVGFGGANNIGFKYAIEHNYDYVYLLSADAQLLPDTLKKMVAAHMTNSEYGILSPMQMQANMKEYDVNFKEIINGLSLDQQIVDVKEVMAAHWLISRDCLLKTGGFSPSFPLYGEDNDYEQRARYFSFKIGIVTTAFGIHDRADRPFSLKHEIYMLDVRNRGILSNIAEPVRFRIIRTLIKTLNGCRRFKTLKPISNWIDLMRNRKTLIENRKRSMKPLAFIDLEDEKPYS